MDGLELGEPTKVANPLTQGESKFSVLKTAPTWYETPDSSRPYMDNIDNPQYMSLIPVPLEVVYPNKASKEKKKASKESVDNEEEVPLTNVVDTDDLEVEQEERLLLERIKRRVLLVRKREKC